MDNPGEILRLCRLCLVKDQVNIPIFEEQGDIRQIFLKISSCLPVKVSLEDKLPKRICDGCSNKLDLLYEFWNTSANAEKTLLSWLGQAGVKDADETISAVAQQIAKPAETQVKQEALDEGHASNQVHDSFGVQSFDEEAKDESEAPPPKRARRTAAVKAQINLTPESDEDDDMDSAEAMTKVEDESDESDGEDKDPSYGEIPGTSADDQAGPSGVGKDGVEAPCLISDPLKIKSEDPLKIKEEEKEDGQEEDKLKSKKGMEVKELKTLFSCTICNTTWPRNFELQNHIVMSHTHEYRYYCQFCNKGFYMATRKRLHERDIHLKLRPYKYKKKEKLDKFTCSECGRKFNCNVFLQQHIAHKHTKEFRLFCEICNKGFFIKSTKEAHVKNTHGDGKGKDKVRMSVGKKKGVKMVDVTYLKAETEKILKMKLKEGQSTSGYTFPMECPAEGCKKVIDRPSALILHLESHSTQKYICEYCAKVFTSSRSLHRHLKFHIYGKTSFKCDICNKSISSATALLNHKRTHTGERPAQCEHCGKGFTCTRDLHIHRAKFHKDVNIKYICGICQKKFQIYGTFKKHYCRYHPESKIPDENVATS